MVVFMSVVVTVWGSMGMFESDFIVCCVVTIVEDSVFSLELCCMFV